MNVETAVLRDLRSPHPHHAPVVLQSRLDWLKSLKVGDRVAVYCGSVRMEDREVTSAPETFVTVGKYRGKLSFSRRTGKLTGKRPMGHLFRIEQP